LNLHFRNLAPNAPAAPPETRNFKAEKAATTKREPVSVLNEFQLSVRDGQVQVTDQDGSVYTGSILPVAPARPPEPRRNASAPAQGPAGRAQNLSSADAYQIDLRGTNRSLQQPVRINGWLSNTGVAQENATPGPARAERKTLGDSTLQQTAAPAGGWQVRSTVKIGSRSQVLNASEVPTAGAAGGVPPNQR
jgi:hypothetical protein